MHSATELQVVGQPVVAVIVWVGLKMQDSGVAVGPDLSSTNIGFRAATVLLLGQVSVHYVRKWRGSCLEIRAATHVRNFILTNRIREWDTSGRERYGKYDSEDGIGVVSRLYLKRSVRTSHPDLYTYPHLTS